MVQSDNPRARALQRRHAVQLWLIAASIVALAVVLAVSITSLRGNADHARQVQLIVAGVNGDAQRISRIEWETTANGRFSRELDEELQLVNSHVLALSHARA
jgi:hypothetical protein